MCLLNTFYLRLSFAVITDLPIIPIKEARRFMKECLKAAGTDDSNASEMADLLVEADYRGHYSHGMNRLGKNLNNANETDLPTIYTFLFIEQKCT